MSSSLEAPPIRVRRGDAASFRWSGRAEMAADRDPSAPVRMRRYLPLALLATGLIIAVPALLVAVVVPPGGLWSTVESTAAAMALSIALASIGIALWKRQPRSRDVVFSDLMLWGWLRRCWTEQRLSEAQVLFESARRAGPSVNIELLTGLSRLLEARDAYVHGHSQRVARHAVRIARAMHLSAAEIAKIRTAAAVHDVGKLYIPRGILNNPARLSSAEFDVVKRHVDDGADMLSAVGDPEITEIVRHHHERIDGRGYPDGLVGSEIPLGARIIAVADTFDAITSGRAYRPASPQKKALDIISRESGSQLDASAVAAFLSCYSARRSVAWLAFATTAPQRIAEGLTATSSSLRAAAGALPSILPAVGAAGVLAASPGLQHAASVDRVGGASGQAPATVGAAPRSEAGRADAGSGVARRPVSQLPPVSRKTPSAPRTALQPGASPVGTPSGSGGATASAPESIASGPQTPPLKSPPAPTPPASPTPPIVVPALPGPSVPSIPPITVSVPAVTTSSVTVPALTPAGVSEPSVETHSLAIAPLGP